MEEGTSLLTQERTFSSHHYNSLSRTSSTGKCRATKKLNSYKYLVRYLLRNKGKQRKRKHFLWKK